MKFIKHYLILAGLIISCTTVMTGELNAPEFVDFFGDVTIDGNPAPIGTVIKAYDEPDMGLCGTFTVGDNIDSIGIYGFLHVIRDDISTPLIDEGADPGETIKFTVNDIDATPTVVSGGLTWTSNGTINEVDLAITGQNVSFNPVFLPNDSLVAPEWTVTLKVGVENTGNGIDFYGITSLDDTSASPGWLTTDQDSVSHADVGDTAYVFFDAFIPLFGGLGDTAFVVHYTVYSHVDTTVKYADSVTLYKSSTDVDDNTIPQLPGQFTLYQNYPNPFNPATVISFNLSSSADVRLDIINALGQIVESRQLGLKSAGEHEISYDASSLASGIYFYRLTADNYAQSKKMLLLK